MLHEQTNEILNGHSVKQTIHETEVEMKKLG